MNTKISNMLQDYQVRQNEQKHNLRNKIFILFLSLTLILASIIIFINYFDVMNQNNMYVDQEIVTGYNSDERIDDVFSNIEIQIFKNMERILADTQINTWKSSDQRYPKVSTLSDTNFVVVWQTFLGDGS